MAFGAMRWAVIRVSSAGVRGGVIAHEEGAGSARGTDEVTAPPLRARPLGAGPAGENCEGSRRHAHWPPFGPLVSSIDGSTARRYDRYVVVTIVPGRVG